MATLVQRKKRLAILRNRVKHTARVLSRRDRIYKKARRDYIKAKRVAINPPDLGARALKEALADLGKNEVGGNNRGAFVDALNRDAGSYIGAPWCGAAVFHWYKMAGSKAVSSRWVYVPWLRQAAGLQKVSIPQAGDIVTFEFNGDQTSDHTGVFERWADKKNGIALVIEGNTQGSGAASDGGGGEGVKRRKRSINLVSGFYRVTR